MPLFVVSFDFVSYFVTQQFTIEKDTNFLHPTQSLHLLAFTMPYPCQ